MYCYQVFYVSFCAYRRHEPESLKNTDIYFRPTKVLDLTEYQSTYSLTCDIIQPNRITYIYSAKVITTIPTIATVYYFCISCIIYSSVWLLLPFPLHIYNDRLAKITLLCVGSFSCQKCWWHLLRAMFFLYYFCRRLEVYIC